MHSYVTFKYFHYVLQVFTRFCLCMSCPFVSRSTSSMLGAAMSNSTIGAFPLFPLLLDFFSPFTSAAPTRNWLDGSFPEISVPFPELSVPFAALWTSFPELLTSDVAFCASFKALLSSEGCSSSVAAALGLKNAFLLKPFFPMVTTTALSVYIALISACKTVAPSTHWWEFKPVLDLWATTSMTDTFLRMYDEAADKIKRWRLKWEKNQTGDEGYCNSCPAHHHDLPLNCNELSAV